MNILKHHVDGIYPLRLVEDKWVMQNKQPLTTNPAIQECIITEYIPA